MNLSCALCVLFAIMAAVFAVRICLDRKALDAMRGGVAIIKLTVVGRGSLEYNG